jgi:hypothetical protein
MELTKDGWKNAFMAELQRLRPHTPDKLAAQIAVTEYEPKLAPKVAAQRYHAARPIPKNAKPA